MQFNAYVVELIMVVLSLQGYRRILVLGLVWEREVDVDAVDEDEGVKDGDEYMLVLLLSTL